MKDVVDSLKDIVGRAALATYPFIGLGEKEEGDQAAVDAMRQAFEGKAMDAIVRVGEGEKDEAPMLYVGEQLGNGQGMKLDIAVDPVEGTALMAAGKPNAIAVIAASERGCFWDAGSAYYMDKIVVGAEAKNAIDINATPEENLQSIAQAKQKAVEDLMVYVLNKPRHQELVQQIEAVGAKVALHDEGDVIGSILALMKDSEIDVLMGIGGAPEAVITAAAVKAVGGGMQGKLAPQKDFEKVNLDADGVDLNQVYQLDDLVGSEHVAFAAAGITSGDLLDGVKKEDGIDVTEVVTIDSESGIRFESFGL